MKETRCETVTGGGKRGGTKTLSTFLTTSAGVPHHAQTVDQTNPKDLIGVKKVSLTKLPPVAVLHTAHAMMNGAVKYGQYNWRDKAVRASIYVDACERHLHAWFDGEEDAADSGVHHLGHAMACLAILLDAQETGNLVDDRPATGRGAFCRVLEQLNAKIAAKTTDAAVPAVDAQAPQEGPR